MEVPVESEPEASEHVPDSPQSAACEPTWEHWKDEVKSVPTECEAVACDVLNEPGTGDNNPQESAGASRCRFEAGHILKGDEWRACDRCRDDVKKTFVPSLGCNQSMTYGKCILIAVGSIVLHPEERW
jgi:hypothetical protein